MALGDIGSGLARMSEGATGGIVQGMRENRMYQLQQDQARRQDEQLKLQQQKQYFDQARMALEMTPDENMNDWLNQYNSTAPSIGLPKLAGVKRINKGEYQLVTGADGAVYTFESTSGKLTQAKDAAGNPVTIAQKPMTLTPGTTLYDPSKKQEVYTSPDKPIIVPEGSTLVNPSALPGSRPTAQGGVPIYTPPNGRILTQLPDGRLAWSTPQQTAAIPQQGQPVPTTPISQPMAGTEIPQPSGAIPTQISEGITAPSVTTPSPMAQQPAQIPIATQQPGVLFQTPAKGAKPSYEQQKAIDAFTAKNGRPPTDQEIPKLLADAKNPAQGIVDSPITGLTGEAAMQNYDPDVQTLARKLVRAEIPYPSSFALKDPKWKTIIQAAADLDPGFNASQFKIRQDVRKSFTSGKDAQTITSINTLVGHLDSLAKSARALDNKALTYWNALANGVITATGDPRVTKFNMDVGAVEGELAAVFKQTGATDQEIKAWRSRINSSQSPAQLQAAVKEAVELMGSRLQALRSKYEAGMGPFNSLQILSPKSRQTLSKMVGKEVVEQLEPSNQMPIEQPIGAKSVSSEASGAMSDADLLKSLNIGQ